MHTSQLSNIPIKSEEAFLRQRTDIDREDFFLGKTAWNNIRQYGAPTWYEWRIQNWGTKWNAYDFANEPAENADTARLCFQTAWSAPHPVIQTFAERFPELRVEHVWADEDIGFNCGRVCYEHGVCTEEYMPETEMESIEFACDVWKIDPSEYMEEIEPWDENMALS